jgi:glucose/arabinose dehydrogenase
MILRNLYLSLVKIILLVLATGPVRANTVASSVSYQAVTLFSDQDVIWGFDFLDKDKIIYTLRSGQIKIYDLQKKEIITLQGLPSIFTKGQGGLLDIRVHPKNSKRILFTFSQPDPVKKGYASTALAEAEIENTKLNNLKIHFTGNNIEDSGLHFGSRIIFIDDTKVMIGVGDRNERDKAQDPILHHGKTLMIDLTNSKSEIWSSGHRNPQGLAIHPKTQEIWETEFGPRGGDELNLIEKGKNYGWPVVTKGREYWGPSIGVKEKTGFTEPVAFWVPSISPSGSNFYFGQSFPTWQGSLFLSCLSGLEVRRVVIENKKVTHQESLFTELKERFRNVREGLDGHLYLSTDSGRILQIKPKL